MELPTRSKNDRLTSAGAHRQLRQDLRAKLCDRELTAVFFYCFDHRTRLLPFIFADVRMVPCGARQVTGTLLDAGFAAVRMVLQQWSPNVRPSRVRLKGRAPDLLLFSAMSLHSQSMYDLIADACTIPPDLRPLVLCGGPKAIYQPADLFHVHGRPEVSSDAACMGEDFILLDLLDRLAHRLGDRRNLRQAFLELRDLGDLADVPGLMYLEASDDCSRLVNTGPQRLSTDLDQLPMPQDAYGHIEPPHSRKELAPHPMPLHSVARKAPIASLTLTQGCRFACGYCPIPAYNQRTYRRKSGLRIAEEMQSLASIGLRALFGTDDNFFDNRNGAAEILETVARFRRDRRGDPSVVWRWGTETTLFDAHRNLDLMQLARESGMQAVWFGIEDLTASLINKGQSAEKTTIVFQSLLDKGIMPMPMMMHSDKQPLLSRGDLRGLLNQIHFLRRAGAGGLSLTMITPAVGTKWFEKPYHDGIVFKTVGDVVVEDRHFDGTHVVASADAKPWRRQLNLLAGYLMFYNPIQMLAGLARRRRWHLVGMDLLLQLVGMAGLTATAGEWLRWAFKLAWGGWTTAPAPPQSSLAIVWPAKQTQPNS